MVIDTSTKSKYRGDENAEGDMRIESEVFKREKRFFHSLP
jgi:hypothetical protein